MAYMEAFVERFSIKIEIAITDQNTWANDAVMRTMPL